MGKREARRSLGCEHLGLAALALLGPVLPAHGHDVAVVLSQDLPAYRDVLRGIEEALGPAVRALDLDRRSGAAIERSKESPPDAVIAIGARAVRAVSEKLPDTPTVYCMTPGDDVPSRAAARVTGVAAEVPVDRQLAAFRDVVPGLERLAVLYDPARSGETIERARTAARRLGIELVAEAVPTAEDVPSALRRAIRRADGVWLIPDRTVVSHDSFRFTLGLAAERRVPLMVFSESMVRAGGLVGLVPDHAEVGRQAAGLVARLLDPEARGAPSSIEPPRTLRLVLNARTAGNLGVPIPPELASRKGTHVYR